MIQQKSINPTQQQLALPTFFSRWSYSGLFNKKTFGHLLLSALIVTEAIVVGTWGIQRSFITYRQDFGETFVAYEQAAQLETTSPRFGLLHVERSLSGKETVYTHNVNIGTLYFRFLRLLGVESLRAETIAVFPVFLLSLYVAYEAVRRSTKSPEIAICFLALMILDFANVGAFAFNALRAWHYLGLFACICAIDLLNASARRSIVLGSMLLFSGASVSFGCGYDFYLVVLLITILTALTFNGTQRVLLKASIIFLSFSFPFFLRQVEIIHWMGFNTWYLDFVTTVAIKVPFASRVISTPSIDQIGILYEKAGLYRPPAFPTSSWIEIWQTLKPLIELAVVPNYGFLGCVLVVVCAILGIIAKLCRGLQTPFVNGAALIFVYLAGALAGLFVFSPFSLHVYMKHDFPLLAALVHLAEALCIVFFLKMAVASTRRRQFASGTSLLLLSLLVVGNSIAVQLVNSAHSKELDFGWRAFPNSHDGAITATASPPESGAVLSNPNSALILAPDKAPWLLASSLGRLVEKPLWKVEEPAEHGKYLIYAPGDGWCNLDAREPDLSDRDWMLSALGGLTHRKEDNLDSEGVEMYIVSGKPEPARPGSIIFLKYFLPYFSGDEYSRYRPSLEVAAADGRSYVFENLLESVARGEKGGSVSLIYNPKFRVLDVYFLAPEALLHGVKTELKVHAVLTATDHLFKSAGENIVFSEAAPEHVVTPVLPEPPTFQLRAAFPEFHVVNESSVGVGYVILDLSHAGGQ